jgi:hypothetical protein
MRLLFALLLLLPAALAFGQIYVYIDPESGAKKFTNIQPRWYSSDGKQRGPRTLLIIKGELADDTTTAYDPSLMNRRLEQAAEYYHGVDERQARSMAEAIAAAQIKAQARATREAVRAKAETYERDAADIKFRRQVEAMRDGRSAGSVEETTKKDVDQYRKRGMNDPARRFEEDVARSENERRVAASRAEGEARAARNRLNYQHQVDRILDQSTWK